MIKTLARPSGRRAVPRRFHAAAIGDVYGRRSLGSADVNLVVHRNGGPVDRIRRVVMDGSVYGHLKFASADVNHVRNASISGIHAGGPAYAAVPDGGAFGRRILNTTASDVSRNESITRTLER